MQGIWKLSFSASRGASLERGAFLSAMARRAVPSRLRLLDPPASEPMGRLEVPMATLSGKWCVLDNQPGDCGAQTVRLAVEGGERLLLLSGLFDGERIAGTVFQLGSEKHPMREVSYDTMIVQEVKGEHVVLGEFLCTRLFTFWGAPKPRAELTSGG